MSQRLHVLYSQPIPTVCTVLMHCPSVDPAWKTPAVQCTVPVSVRNEQGIYALLYIMEYFCADLKSCFNQIGEEKRLRISIVVNGKELCMYLFKK